MTTRNLLDTNVVSQPLRPNPAPGILRRMRAHEQEIALPAVVWHELQFGCARLRESRRRSAIEHYLNEVVGACFPILSYDRGAAEWHARERGEGRTRGRNRDSCR
ncbi:MAG: PIN domain-containing protein [Acidobacteria bacterium]|nr:PIN domain-containing protein [Acidobacteriota bacterium]NIQ86268.1 PIN domain-containing protein [Acidobacteriota bacterium]